MTDFRAFANIFCEHPHRKCPNFEALSNRCLMYRQFAKCQKFGEMILSKETTFTDYFQWSIYERVYVEYKI